MSFSFFDPKTLLYTYTLKPMITQLLSSSRMCSSLKTGGTITLMALLWAIAPVGNGGAHAHHQPDTVGYAASTDALYATQNVTIPTPAGHTLAGTLTVPDVDSAPMPAVLLFHGSGRSDRDQRLSDAYRPFRAIADTLSRRGIAVLRYDKRGVGASTGDYATATTADFVADARAALAFLQRRADIDTDRIGLIGHSEGGLIAPRVAATNPEVASLALLAAPAEPGRAMLTYQARQHVLANSTVPPDSLNAATEQVLSMFLERARQSVGPWVDYFLAYDPAPSARLVDAPTLIVQGDKDTQVPPDQADTLAQLIRAGDGPEVVVQRFPKRGHLFVTDPQDRPVTAMDPAVLATLSDWMNRTLSP